MRILWLAIACALVVGGSARTATAQGSGHAEITVKPDYFNGCVYIDFTRDQRRLVTYDTDVGLRTWDVGTGRVLSVFPPMLGSEAARTAQWRTMGNGRVAVLIPGERIDQPIVWQSLDLASGVIVARKQLSGMRGEPRMSGDGRKVAVFADERRLLTWEPDTGRTSPVFTFPGPQSFAGAVFTRDGARVVLLTNPDVHMLAGPWVVSIVDLARSAVSRSFRVGRAQGEMTLSADGRYLHLAGAPDQPATLWDTETGRPVREMHATLDGTVIPLPGGSALLAGAFCGALSGDGRSLAIAPRDADLEIRDVVSGERIRRFSHRIAKVGEQTIAKVTAGGTRMVAVTSIGPKRDRAEMGVWDLENGTRRDRVEVPGTFILADTSRDAALALGYTLDPGHATSALTLWDVGSGTTRTRITLPGTVIDTTLTTGDHRILLRRTEGETSTVSMLDLDTARVVRTFGAWQGSHGFTREALSPDGRVLAIAHQAERSAITLYDMASGKALRSLDAKGYGSRTFAFSRDGRLLMFDGTGPSGPDNRLQVWDVAGGRLVRDLGVSTSSHLLVDDDGQGLLVDADGTYRRIELTTGRTLRQWKGVPWSGVPAFVSGTRNLLVDDAEGTQSILDARTGERLATLVTFEDGEWLTITPEGFFVGSDAAASRLSAVQGGEARAIDRMYQALYRPDLVREKIAGDPRGLVRRAAAALDLTRVLASGAAPLTSLVSPPADQGVEAAQIALEAEITDVGGGVGRIEWRVNGVVIGLDDGAAQPVSGGRRRVRRTVDLVRGENRIEVVAYNAGNLIASVPSGVRVTRTGATAIRPRLFVLAVGVNDYADARLKLQYAVPDARALAAALSAAGGTLYASVQATTLIDAEVRRGGIDAAFARLAAAMRPEDVFVLFVAGHGKTVEGRYYFIPQDFHLDGVESVLAHGIGQGDWQTWFGRIPARRSVLMFDTCESGSLVHDGEETRALERGAAASRLERATGRTILTAATDDKPAFEGFREHGLFAYNVLEAIERADADGNGEIGVVELAAYVYAQVTTLSERAFGSRQVPEIRIAGTDYGLIRPTPVPGLTKPALVIALQPTHVATGGASIAIQPLADAARVRTLAADLPVTLMRQEAEWDLVATGGHPLGYILARELRQTPK